MKTPARTRPDLSSLVADVLANLAFMISDDPPERPLEPQNWLYGEIHYRGPVSGTVGCWCTPQFAVQLAANLLGTDPDSPDASCAAEDALRELLNVVGGHVVTAWYGTSPVFTLSIPTVARDAPPPQTSDDFCRLHIDGQPLWFCHEALPTG